MICWYVRMNLSTDTKEYNSFYTDEANWSHAAFIITKNHIIYFLGVVRPNSVTEKILPSRYRRMLLAPTVTRGSGAARSTTRRIPRTWSTRYNPVLTHMTRFESEKKTRSNGSPACHSLVSRSGDVLPLSLDSLHLKKRCTPVDWQHVTQQCLLPSVVSLTTRPMMMGPPRRDDAPKAILWVIWGGGVIYNVWCKLSIDIVEDPTFAVTDGAYRTIFAVVFGVVL